MGGLEADQDPQSVMKYLGMRDCQITPEEFRQILRGGLPSGEAMNFDIVTLERGHAALLLRTHAKDLRPGGTVAGPVLFALADLAMFAAVLSVVGSVPMAVTTDATVHFLRRPPPGNLLARARLLKHGLRLLVGEISIAHEEQADVPVAHVVMTYAVPPVRSTS
jgi:uncharacterized protein (TIGR00369 family)